MRIDNTGRYRLRPGQTRSLTNARNPSEWKRNNKTKRMSGSVQLIEKHILKHMSGSVQLIEKHILKHTLQHPGKMITC